MNKGVMVFNQTIDAAQTMGKREVIHSVVSGLRKVSDQSGKHRSIARMARMTDLQGGDLSAAISKLTAKERNDMIKAFSELDRVVHAVANPG